VFGSVKSGAGMERQSAIQAQPGKGKGANARGTLVFEVLAGEQKHRQ